MSNSGPMDLTVEHPDSATAARLKFSRRIIQGVEYHHTQGAEFGDLFLTRFGLPFAAQLHPTQWLAAPWFQEHRRRLRGTSTIYHTQSKPFSNKALDLVVRFNRLGQHLPVDTATRDGFTNATFNSPFEEITQLMALRTTRFGPERRRISTKRPLAIYSPPEVLQPWQTGRNESEVASKQARAPEARLDPLRHYILVYGWIKGIDAQDAADHVLGGGALGKNLLRATLAEVEGELEQAGFRVLDMKPAHIIVRFTDDGRLLRRKNGRLVYALVDYELLEHLRTGGSAAIAACDNARITSA